MQLVLERGRRAIGEADLLVLVVDGREGLVRWRSRDCPGGAGGGQAGAAGHQQDRRPSRAQRRARDVSARVRARSSRSPPSTATASATCSTRSSHALPAPGGSAAAAKPVEVVSRDRWSSECGQVLAGQSVAPRRAHDRERDAGHDARRGRHRADLAPTHIPNRRYGRHPPAGARGERGTGRDRERAARQTRDRIRRCRCAGRRCLAGATDQDAAIAGEADRLGRGIIIAANKWDLTKDNGPDFVKASTKSCGDSSSSWTTRPSCTSRRRPASGRRGCSKRSTRWRSRGEHGSRTTDLNKFVERVSAEHPPASPGKGHVRILYAAQTDVAPPTFVFFTNIATTFHFSYQRYLENRLREEFGFEGTPIRIHVRARRRKDGDSRSSKGPPAREGAARATPGKRSSAKRRGRKPETP